ncbi:MAG TPA: ATPase domain-containing protein, partial [Nevskiaceae bacterium]|nr:ATPase domain-containing protein [Nevskiaceae bacterium]
MARTKTQYICQSCGAVSLRWAGQCADCGEWNTLVESAVPARSAAPAAAGRGAAGAVRRLHEIRSEDAPRTPSGLAEVDRVLGGGLVPGAVILIGGDPGIGKSTLLLQVLAAVDGRVDTLYVTGEESLSQVSMRASRLG